MKPIAASYVDGVLKLPNTIEPLCGELLQGRIRNLRVSHAWAATAAAATTFAQCQVSVRMTRRRKGYCADINTRDGARETNMPLDGSEGLATKKPGKPGFLLCFWTL
jgi:hypothetical protein